MFFLSPFEQFIINPSLKIIIGIIDCTISNVTFTYFIILFFCYLIVLLITDVKTNTYFIYPTKLESTIHLFYSVIQYILERHINVKYYQQFLFPTIFSLAAFLLIINLIGNIPGCFSLTSQIGVVCAFALPMIFGFLIWSIYDRKGTFLRTFHSPGTPGSLAMLLFPIELLTYFMRPFSIICRLVANFMSGHIIIKVLLGGIAQFAFSKSSLSIIATLFSMVSICLLVPLVILELAISVIQVYVFLVIFCMFLSDSFGHHFRH